MITNDNINYQESKTIYLRNNQYTHIDTPIARSADGGTVTWADMIDFGSIELGNNCSINGSWASVLNVIQSLITRIETLENTPAPITQYTVTYNSNGGSSTPSAQQVNAGSSVTLASAISRNADSSYTYTFAGWNTSSEGNGASYNAGASFTPTSNITLYAIWNKIAKYTVTFDSNGGSAVSSITREAGAAIGTLPTSSRTGYNFNGWYTASSGGSQISASTTVNANITYYAHWTIKTYTVTLNVTNGSITSGNASQTVNHGNSAQWTVNPVSGYEMPTSVNGAAISGNTVIVSNVTSDKAISLTCTQPAVQYYWYVGTTVPTADNLASIKSGSMTAKPTTWTASNPQSISATNNTGSSSYIYYCFPTNWNVIVLDEDKVTEMALADVSTFTLNGIGYTVKRTGRTVSNGTTKPYYAKC